ncbi:MAG: hypothetical protein AAGA29_04265, partial [Planctomycetota bacterium]
MQHVVLGDMQQDVGVVDLLLALDLLDTTNILFICSGSFVGLDDIIRKRLGQKAIGFGAEQVKSEKQINDSDILLHV